MNVSTKKQLKQYVISWKTTYSRWTEN